MSVAVDAGSATFRFYHEGVIPSQQYCGTKLSHAVVAVGYGVETPYEVWKVRNSWGAWWGQNGYVYIARNVADDTKGGVCGILIDDTYPEVNDS